MPEGMSATAASALSQSLEAPRSGAGVEAGRLGAERRWVVVVKRRVVEGNVLLAVRARLGLDVVVVVVLEKEVVAARLRIAVGRVDVWARERTEGMERRRCREGVAMVVDARFLGGKRLRERIRRSRAVRLSRAGSQAQDWTSIVTLRWNDWW